MRRVFVLAVMMVIVMGINMQTHAALELRGTDTLGYGLIYDSDLGITWYDLTKSQDTWQNQMDWAAALSVSFGADVFDDWRLTTVVNGPWALDVTAGYNRTSSEMGHLYYTELGNIPDGGLLGTGPFTNLSMDDYYWSATTYGGDTNYAWEFHNSNGFQTIGNKGIINFAIAVRTGDVLSDISSVPVVPEPVSSILFLTGGVILGLKSFRKKQISV